MIGKRRRGLGWIALVGVVVTAPAAWSHHAASQFDPSKQYVMHGVVKEFLWKNPHAWLYMEVPKDDKAELWGFESGGPNMLIRAGWHASDLKPGDKVTITGSPARSGEHTGALVKVVLANGKELSAAAAPDKDQPASPFGGDSKPIPYN